MEEPSLNHPILQTKNSFYLNNNSIATYLCLKSYQIISSFPSQQTANMTNYRCSSCNDVAFTLYRNNKSIKKQTKLTLF